MRPSADSDAHPDIDTVLTVLSNRSRRALLGALLRESALGPRGLGTVRDTLDAGRSFELTFDHVHVPSFEATGLATYDRRTGTLERGPAFEANRPLIELLESGRRPTGNHRDPR